MREKGVVKWFNAAKGYGFIQRSSGEDVFVHFSAVQMSGYRTLEEGAEVEFEVKTGPKGLQAENVNPPQTVSAKREIPQFNERAPLAGAFSIGTYTIWPFSKFNLHPIPLQWPHAVRAAV